MRSFSLLVVMAIGLVSGLAMNGVAEDAKSASKDKTIVELAAGNPDFSTLVAAVKAADLAETLSGPGPFTVFAPNNAAFEKLPKGTLEDLLKPENKKKLVELLKYHVVAGKVLAADVVKLDKVKTVQGQQAKIEASKSAVKIDDAKVIKTDLMAKNGVIHVIDSVIMPSKE